MYWMFAILPLIVLKPILTTNHFKLTDFTLNRPKEICNMSDDKTIYQFTVKGANGEDVSLEKYRGKVVLIVNVASACGLTTANYEQLTILLKDYKAKGLEVAAFPCNQFGHQESGCSLDIEEKMTGKFGIEADFYDKIDVNGKSAAPLYVFLKKEQGGTLIDAIKWNFTKFLVDREGKVIKRYGPTTEPKSFIKDIEQLL
uniref:Glutathione peroxidase n=1 Tax=Rhabditophanes sp. KR3021 TaxID=114890 RepID=A0AC35TRA3_9BILA